MYAHERHQKIAEILHSSSFQSVEKLAAALNVSVATVRRDLSSLASRNELVRVHGGAVCLHYGLNRPAAARSLEETEDAAQLARAALETIRNGETIARDSGPNVLELAKLLPRRSQLTGLASSTVAAWSLRDARHLRVLCLGGESIPAGKARELVKTFLATRWDGEKPEGARHANRVAKIKDLEQHPQRVP